MMLTEEPLVSRLYSLAVTLCWLAASGTIVAWDYAAFHSGENAFRGQRGADTPYDVDNVRIRVAASESPLQSGSYRSLGGATNHFAREVHMDEIAIETTGGRHAAERLYADDHVMLSELRGLDELAYLHVALAPAQVAVVVLMRNRGDLVHVGEVVAAEADGFGVDGE